MRHDIRGWIKPVRDYWYYGLRLRTDLALVGLPRWHETGGGADIVLRQGDVPECLPAPLWSTDHLSVDAQGAGLVRYPGEFRLMAAPGGREAWISLQTPSLSMVTLEAYLLAPVAGMLLHQRRVLALHAGSLEIGGKAVLFTGHSGRGKSTLAAALLRAGHRLLSDDITVIRFDGDGGTLAVPGSPHLRLQEDAIAATGIDPTALVQGRFSDHKKIWRRMAHDPTPVPVGAVFRLEIGETASEPTVERLRGPAALMPLREIVYRITLGRRLGRVADLAEACLRLAAAAPIYRLIRPRSLDSLPATLALITGTLDAARSDVS